jgi:hypothetical protein
MSGLLVFNTEVPFGTWQLVLPSFVSDFALLNNSARRLGIMSFGGSRIRQTQNFRLALT